MHDITDEDVSLNSCQVNKCGYLEMLHQVQHNNKQVQYLPPDSLCPGFLTKTFHTPQDLSNAIKCDILTASAYLLIYASQKPALTGGNFQ